MSQEHDTEAGEDDPFPRDVEPMDQFSAHLDRGWDLVNRGDMAGARVSAEKSLELDAQSPEAHNLLGYIEAAQDNAESALEHYRHAIDLDESFVEAMLNAAELLIHPLHDFDGALEIADDALDFAEGDDEIADALLVKFDAYMHQSERQRARDVVEQLPEGPFENVRLEFLVGRAKLEVGMVDEAAAALERAVDAEPANPDVHYYLGLVRENQEDSRRATLAFLRTRELDLRQPRVRWSLEEKQFERRVRGVLEQLPSPIKAVLDGALIVISDVPGAEVVADGVDPRALILLDDLSKPSTPPTVGRVFIYQRNLERFSTSLLDVEEEMVKALQHEVAQAFPDHFETPDETDAAPVGNGHAPQDDDGKVPADKARH